MNVIGLSVEEQDQIHRILAAILWLGNITFEEGEDSASRIVDLSGKQAYAVLV